MNKSGHQARKRFGQNFLHDQHIIARIIQAIAPDNVSGLIEIGPGQGALTRHLLEHTDSLDVIEIDRDLATMLVTQYGHLPGFKLHETDVLKFDFSTLPVPEDGFRIIGNLPYNISTPLIFHLLNYHERIRDMIFMLQLEVVDRMIAQPNDSNYGRLSIMVQYYCRVEKLFKVPPTAFNPQPKVDSAIVKLIPHTTFPHPVTHIQTLQVLVRSAFNQRRKTIRNTLKNFMTAEQMSALEIDLSLRPENLSLADYARISNLIDLQK